MRGDDARMGLRGTPMLQGTIPERTADRDTKSEPARTTAGRSGGTTPNAFRGADAR